MGCGSVSRRKGRLIGSYHRTSYWQLFESNLQSGLTPRGTEPAATRPPWAAAPRSAKACNCLISKCMCNLNRRQWSEVGRSSELAIEHETQEREQKLLALGGPTWTLVPRNSFSRSSTLPTPQSRGIQVVSQPHLFVLSCSQS